MASIGLIPIIWDGLSPSSINVLCVFVFACDQRKSRRYYPTRLAITLAAGVTTTTFSLSSSTPAAGDAGFIILETNYRIYAYTSMSEHWSCIIILINTLQVLIHTRPAELHLCVALSFTIAVFVSSLDSELQIALVALFSEMLYRFPNVVVAQITRESVQQAIANGITAQQVLPPHDYTKYVFIHVATFLRSSSSCE